MKQIESEVWGRFRSSFTEGRMAHAYVLKDEGAAPFLLLSAQHNCYFVKRMMRPVGYVIIADMSRKKSM